MKRVLLIGKGGREHALAYLLSKSPLLERLFVAPGNAGTREIAENVPIDPLDFVSLITFSKKNDIDLVVVGPEDPISRGIKESLGEAGISVFAPSKNIAFLEASKAEARKFMKKNGIPVPKFKITESVNDAKKALLEFSPPYVIKADGLAGGKGVSIVKSEKEAINTLKEYIEQKKFGESSKKVVIEEYLAGVEVSVFIVSDGKSWKILGSAHDYKRLLDGDRGPNTGGMGSVAPSPYMDLARWNGIVDRVIRPTFRGLEEENFEYQGILYLGLIWAPITPYVLEYNIRFGDPETQALVPLFDFDLLSLAIASLEGKIKTFPVSLRTNWAVCVVIASSGYPGHYEKGKVIEGLEMASKQKNVFIFQAGTKFNEGHIVTDGGRVLNVVGVGNNLSSARENAYRAVEKIHFEGMHFRKDIAHDA